MCVGVGVCVGVCVGVIVCVCDILGFMIALRRRQASVCVCVCG